MYLIFHLISFFIQFVFYVAHHFGFWVLFFFFFFLFMNAENINDSCVYATSIYRKNVYY